MKGFVLFMFLFGYNLNGLNAQNVVADFIVADQSCDIVEFQNLSYATGGVTITGYLWDFGDGNTSTTVDPVHTYVAEGNYNVVLSVSHDGGGGPETHSKFVYVWNPSSDFGPASTCLGVSTEYITNATTPPNSEISIWEWDFDNNGTFEATGMSVFHTFLVAGPQPVTHKVTNDLGCSHEATKTIQVFENPVADFNSDTVCEGSITHFINLSSTPSGSITSYSWDFDDDGIPDSFDENPGFLFPASGTYPVELKVENSLGCLDSIQKDVLVYQEPVADFTVNLGCPKLESEFFDASTAGSAPIVFWEWNFGDGSPVNNTPDPIHIFATSGDFEVNLYVEDSNGCSDDTTMTISTFKPFAGFTSNDICFGWPSNFTDTSLYQPGYEIVSWNWDFDDGNFSTLQNPTNIYSAHGEYDVELVVTNTMACTDTTNNIVLIDTLPVAGFEHTAACAGLQTCFTDTSVANGGVIDSWIWIFGDGNNSTNQNPCHIYMNEGEYVVTLIVVNSDGCSSAPFNDTIYVSKAPDVNFSFNDVCFGDTTYFENLTDTFGYDAAYWRWTFGNPGSGNDTSALFSPSHLFMAPGSYNVKLLAENEYGCQDSIVKVVTVDSIPEAYFTIPDTVSIGAQFTITDLSVPHGSPILTKFWQFGDGNTATNINPVTHTYDTIGEYVICLTVDDFNGCSHQYCDSITVIGRPVADFNYASSADLQTFFYDESTPDNSITDWYWEFGDPTTITDTSEEENPDWTYQQEGWYSVYLLVTDKFGGMDDTLKSVYCGNALIAGFSVDKQCLGDSTIFSDTTFSPINALVDNYFWDLGDGTTMLYTEPQEEIKHLYPGPGNYQVKFAVSAIVSGFFMSDTMYYTVTIYEPPVARIDSIGLGVCFGTPIQFTDLTTSTADTIKQWFWDFDTDQGNFSTLKNPVHNYADTGTYNVSMAITTKHGCQSSDSVLAHVNFAPSFGFNVENNCLNSPTKFVPQYDSSVFTITSWLWRFEGNDSSILSTPTYVYDKINVYSVTMEMEAYDCAGEYTKSFLVYPVPYSDFTLTPNFGDIQGKTKFTNNSIYAQSYLWDFGNGNESTAIDPIEIYEYDSTYTIKLIAYNEYSCTDTSEAELTVFFKGLYFPTAFSPNNPNEEISLFTPKGVNLAQYLVQVFDLRGNLVWESDKLNEDGSPVESWDGYYDGTLMPLGMYIWRAAGKFRDGTIWKGQNYEDAPPQTNGTVTLIR